MLVCFYVVVAVHAATAIANVVKSSLGPLGLDKMMVDDIGVSSTSTYTYVIIES